MPKKEEKSKTKKSTTAKSKTKKKSTGGLANVIGKEHKKAKKIKISKKEIKRDELKETSATIVEYLTAHSNRVLVITGTLIILLLIVILMNFYKSSRKEKVGELFTRARNLYDLGLNDAPPSTATLKGSLELFDSLISNYKGGVEEGLSYFYEGNIYFNLQEYDNAIEAYRKFLDFDIKNEVYISIAKTNIAYCYENKDEYEKAIEMFKDISNNSKGYLKISSLYNLGMAYEKIDKYDEATKVYQDFINDNPRSVLIEKVQERINSIQAK